MVHPVRSPLQNIAPLADPFGRTVWYLRVSLTDRCNFRCYYCMAEAMSFLPKAKVLSLEEIDRLCTAFIRLGTRKLRLTGDEPLARPGVMDLARSLGRHLKTGDLDELTLTTNGAMLFKHAKGLANAGVKRINVSLDAGPSQVPGRHPLGQTAQGHRRHTGGERCRFCGQDQRGGAQGCQRRRVPPSGGLVRHAGRWKTPTTVPAVRRAT